MNTNTCINCKLSNNKLSKVEKGLSLTWCRKHRQHVSPTDSCEYLTLENKGALELNNVLANFYVEEEDL